MVEIGESVPKIKLVDTEFKQVSLPKASRGKAAVIAFFPGAFTGVCTKEMCTFRDGMSQMNALNANLYAISVDGPFANKMFKEHNSLNFTLLSDYKRKAVKKFDVALNDFAQLKGYVAAKRAVFVADSKGIVKYKWISEDPAVEPNYAEIQTALQSIN
jgi:peroxiredoxin